MFIREVESKMQMVQDQLPKETLSKIRFNQLLILIDDLKGYTPQSKIKKEKKLIIDYLHVLVHANYDDVTMKDIYTLEKKYIHPILSKLDRDGYGYTIKNSWILVFLVFFIIDAILIATKVSKWYFHIPIFAIISGTFFFIRENKAKKMGKLW